MRTNTKAILLSEFLAQEVAHRKLQGGRVRRVRSEGITTSSRGIPRISQSSDDDRVSIQFLYLTLEQALVLAPGCVVRLTGPDPYPQKVAYELQKLVVTSIHAECLIYWALPADDFTLPSGLLVILEPFCPLTPATMSILGMIGVGSVTIPFILPVEERLHKSEHNL
ncbi:hypothetical protein BDY19DRAFT_999030 [Irpex rosettiformis]|uniref:Uncharacterized protein n=1 Tax=Irpex rosettiformis TaxID=378272 RepID=A0ACB8TLX1_9APHY|nr:hypothetical protein BDY19DRAFT_999030 [Irpex rosettiformis]